MNNASRSLPPRPAASLTTLSLSALMALTAACRPSETAQPDASVAATPTVEGSTATDPEIQWLEQHSMLHAAKLMARQYAGKGEMWEHPYAHPQPRAASAMASVWFTAYPAATISAPDETVLETLGDERLWQVFGEIGIEAIHTGPMKRSGGIRDRQFTPTVDGNFDRISNEIDPAFGTDEQYKTMVAHAKQNGAIVIGDVIPGHSGKGADFRLAERGYGDYPGLYHMVSIKAEDWDLLPKVPGGKDSVNLPPKVVDELEARGYIVGQLPRTIFYEPGVKETDWSVTDVVKGHDGVERRWVYLHYFKEGQPTFNWLDPTFAAQRLVLGDALHSIGVLGESMLRLDANGFLGIETEPEGAPADARAWSEGHPLSVTSNQLIAGMVRKLGGFTFQELNLTLEDIKAMSNGGADLSYDFVTRPAYHHALATGDASFLRLMQRIARDYDIDPAGLVHALQNHDELTLELVHFWTLHKDDTFDFRGKLIKGSQLRDIIRSEMHGKLMGDNAPYNLKAANGISSTSASIAAASLGIKDLSNLDEEQKRQIQKAHLLLAYYNALQPGVFALSGWDLVGALTLPGESVKDLLADGDTRWINRGAYDLMGQNSAAQESASGLPRAPTLYGSLPEQLEDPNSFVSQLDEMLEIRKEYRINESQLVDLPAVKAKGLVVMVHRLPDDLGIEVTALNFGQEPVTESVAIKAAPAGATVRDLFDDGSQSKLSGTKLLKLELGAHEGTALLVK